MGTRGGGVKLNINRTVRINCIAGKCHLPCPNGHHHESFINVFSGFSTFWRYPNRLVGKHYSVGLIQLQRRRSDAVAAQRRCILKCAVKTSAVIITASVLRCCSCAASVCPKMCGGEKLVWRIFSSFYFAHFLSSELCSHWLTKNKHCLWLVGQNIF